MRFQIAFAVLTLSTVAAAQDIGNYNRALAAFNAGTFDDSARAFFELSETSTDPDIRAKSEYYLAQSLSKKGLPFAALQYYGAIVQTGAKHPFYLKAVEGLANVQRELNDPFLVPSIINRDYNADAWATLPLEVLARINYLIGVIEHRNRRLEDAQAFLSAVPKETAIYAKAHYLLGVVFNDVRYPGGAKPDEAIKAFDDVLALSGDRYEELTDTQHLAILGLARTYYGTGQYQKAVDYYEKIPRFSKYWNVALFENGWARFQNDDRGGALGSLQALHAPQFAGAFEPESWIVKATAYYFNCLYDETKSTLGEFDSIYKPMDEQLRKVLEGGDNDPAYFYKVVATEEGNQLPRPVLNWVRANARMLAVFGMISELDREKAAITGNAAWQGSKIGTTLVESLDATRNVTLIPAAGQFAKNRIQEAVGSIKGFSDTAEIIRFETSKAEKELFESGVDQAKILAGQNIYRPAMPAEDWNYWRFQGEFWIDEIGYYQYTLRNGCPAPKGE